MNMIDRAILEHCAETFRPLKPLREQIPQGTLYRHVHRLVRLGWLERESGLYRTTDAGRRQLLDAELNRRWDRLEEIYPPLRLIPTPLHRAFVELIFAALVARQHPTRPDRHPFFVAYGQTLRWKTSIGLFVCHALGLDPATYCIECASESGKSLFVRRGQTGEVTFKRTLLDAPFVTFDEFLACDQAVKATLLVFLRGRLTVPFENESLTIRPVPLVTLNPRAKSSLEERLGLSTPQLRRAIVANFDAVALPDLSTTGEEALAEAKAHGPLTLGVPAGDCARHLKPIVQLVRTILVEEAQERVDIHVVVNLCSGMTAFLPEPLAAIVQVGHALGLLAESMGWARPGWIEGLADFSLDPNPRTPASLTNGDRAGAVVMTAQQTEPLPSTLSFQVPRLPREQHAAIPTVSQAVRDRMTWLAVETGRSLDESYTMLIDLYLVHREGPHTIPILRRILALAHQLKVFELDVNDVRGYLALRAMLNRHRCDFTDVPEALRLIDCLSVLPQSWRWAEMKYVIGTVALALQEGISASEVEEFLVRHRQLGQLGFDEATAVTVAEALKRAGAMGRRRAAVITRLVCIANGEVEVDDWEAARDQKKAEVQGLDRQIRDAEARLAKLHDEESEIARSLEQLDQECLRKASRSEVLAGFESFLLGGLGPDDPFWQELERLLQLRRTGAIASGQAQKSLQALSIPKVVEFLTYLVGQARGG